MTESVKISALELENIKRVRAVALEPTADGLTVIGGRNAQGKTSVLDAIAWALGGDKLKPASPNRDGAANPARLHVELSNGIVVERKGKNGALKVTDSRGMKGGQQLLNAFVSALALDLPKFLDGTDKQRADYLLGILGVDEELARIDREYKGAYDERRFIGRDADAKAKAADAMPYYADAPDEPVSVAELTTQLQDAYATNESNRQKRADVEQMSFALNKSVRDIDELNERLAQLKRDLDFAIESHDAIKADYEKAQAEAAGLADVDTATIENAIASAEGINAHVRANADKVVMQSDADALRAKYDGLTDRLAELKAERTKLLDDAGMPLPGLSVEDDTLTYNGHVWSDMSGAEQLRVATAITRATKPECGFVLVDKLEQFDTQQLAEFAAWAEGEGLQVIGTRVATDDSCTVVIEDGRIVGQDMAETPAPNPRGEAIIAWGGETF